MKVREKCRAYKHVVSRKSQRDVLPWTKTLGTTVIHLEVPTRKSQRDALPLTDASGKTLNHREGRGATRGASDKR